jgi:hypothetical protein
MKSAIVVLGLLIAMFVGWGLAWALLTASALVGPVGNVGVLVAGALGVWLLVRARRVRA